MTSPAPRVVVTSRSFGMHAPDGLRVLQDAGCEVVLRGDGGPWSEEVMCTFAQDADALIVGADRITPRVLKAGRRLRVIARHGVGVDNIDLPAAAARGVMVTYAPGASTDAVAELTIALLLALWRGLLHADRSVRAHRWDRVVGRGIKGRTLGIIGLGRIGRAVAAMAPALGMRVIAFDTVQDQVYARRSGIRYCSLEELLRTADAVSIHVPLLPSTRGLIGARELGWMRSEALLINVARGGIVDEQALAAALREGRLAGAAVDVFEQEPPGQSPLVGLENAILTPHIGAYTREALMYVDLVVARDVTAVLRGEHPAYPVPHDLDGTGG